MDCLLHFVGCPIDDRNGVRARVRAEDSSAVVGQERIRLRANCYLLQLVKVCAVQDDDVAFAMFGDIDFLAVRSARDGAGILR